MKIKSLAAWSFALLLALVASMANARGVVTYYHNDLLGSPTYASNQFGQVKWQERYKPHGERIDKPVAAKSNDIWYTGKPHDEDMGLTYMNARYYDPVIGRFMSVDPQEFTENNPMTFNRYAYVNNNPYKYTDPTGEIAETPWDAINVAMGVTSMGVNIATGNWIGAAADGVGLVWDTAATLMPGMPGGAATGLNAYRAGKVTANVATRVANKAIEIGPKVFSKDNISGFISENVIKKGDDLIFENFTMQSVNKGKDLIGPAKQMLEFVKEQGAKNIRLKGSFSDNALKDKFGGSSTFDITLPATKADILETLRLIQ